MLIDLAAVERRRALQAWCQPERWRATAVERAPAELPFLHFFEEQFPRRPVVLEEKGIQLCELVATHWREIVVHEVGEEAIVEARPIYAPAPEPVRAARPLIDWAAADLHKVKEHFDTGRHLAVVEPPRLSLWERCLEWARDALGLQPALPVPAFAD